MNEVLVLHAALSGIASVQAVTRLLEALPYAYRLAIGRRDEDARLASLAGIALLLEAVRWTRGEPPDLRSLRAPAGGKPMLEGGPPFSIAHSAARVAVAIGERGELGLDVEDLGSGGRTLREIECWTATEAALKAMGAGLRELRAVRLDDDLRGARFGATRLHLRPVTLADGCVACLASADPVSAVKVREIEWPV